ncbi:efflux RND transporter periplasmic adaptor subunit [Roseovarius aestuariivivens]|uniref:efflux RND transporter periplasmic adaptor subunit n=1 Tax=Roseovarius aestuariivivens TaxID=1888910 RepID=UPI001436C30B|nr:efflux RND transporter periplasmic adaptor subunit [Roseovarius aestuariivivens]
MLAALVGCREEETEAGKIIRGLKVHAVSDVERSQTRRFPGVLEPPNLTVLSFEIGGRLEEINLAVGQRVDADDVIARLDTESLNLQVQSAEAAVIQAETAAREAAETLTRQEQLLESGTVTRVSVDSARTQAEAAAASLIQAQKSLETARKNLEGAELVAPFNGIVNSVDARSFSTVSPGAPVASVYSSDRFEVALSVGFDAVSELVVGTPARIRLADRPDITLAAAVSEIGARADAVSSFPIVLQLRETDPIMKAGMAVEASIDFPLAAREGYLLPLTALIKDGLAGTPGSAEEPARAAVFVFDDSSSTVKRREIAIGGIRENMIVVTEGLEPGDLVASAGVSFLKDGQEVKLLGEGD